MFMHDHVHVTLGTEIWLRKCPSWQIRKWLYGGHIGLGQNCLWRAPRSYDRSWLFSIWMRSIHSCLRAAEWFPYVKYMENEISHMVASWIKNTKWGYVHQWVTIYNVHAWPCPGDIIKYWDMTAETSILTTKNRPYGGHIGLDKKIFDLHQGLMIGHDCAPYEWDPFIHVWERAMEWFPYILSI